MNVSFQKLQTIGAQPANVNAALKLVLKGKGNKPAFEKNPRLLRGMSRFVNRDSQKLPPEWIMTGIRKKSQQELYDIHDVWDASEGHVWCIWQELLKESNPGIKINRDDGYYDQPKNVFVIKYKFENFDLERQNLDLTSKLTDRMIRLLKKIDILSTTIRMVHHEKFAVGAGYELHPVFDSNIGELIQIVEWKAGRENRNRMRFEHLRGIIEHRLGNCEMPLSSRLKKKIEHLPKEHLETLWLRMRLLDEAVFARSVMRLKRQGHRIDVGCDLAEGAGGFAVFRLKSAQFSPGSLHEAEETLAKAHEVKQRIREVCIIIRGTNHFRLNDGLGSMNDAAVEHNINNVLTNLNLYLYFAKKGKEEFLLPKG